MATKFPAFLFYNEDFATGTAHMSPLAVGVYIRCLCHQWSHGSIPIDVEQLTRLCGALPDEMSKAWPVVVKKFVEASEGQLINKRLEEVRKELIAKSKKRSRAGKSGARSRWSDGKRNATEDAIAMANGCEVDGKTMASRVEDVNEDVFESFWKVFPSGRKKAKGKAREAFLKASKKAKPEVIISAAAEYAASEVGRGEFVQMPSTWLHGECWNDDRNAWKEKGSDGKRRNDIGPGQRHDPATATRPPELGFR